MIVCAVDFAAWCAVVLATVMSRSDAATKGLDQAAGLIISALYLVTGAPAITLTLLGRGPRTALLLALAFPGVLVVAFVAAVVALA